ncbi:MAG TPA: glycosyltransferase family 39 protein [Acidimicrobiales bacterium]|nr:glycosyltransferase family 39 protein [Acidimicrobiales bacterium]
MRRIGRGLVIGRHRVFTALFLAGVLLRVLTTMAYWPAMEFVQDSFDYLYDARNFEPGIIRPFGYPLFLRLLSMVGHLAVVPLIQHVLGLSMGVLLYALVRRLGARPGLAALAAAPVLLDPYQVHLEHFLMAETLFASLLVGALALLLWHERPSPLACVGAGLALAAAALTRTAGVFLLVPAVAFLLLRRTGWRRVLAATGAAVTLLAAYMTWFQSVHGRFSIAAYEGYFLAGRVAPFADCSRFPVPPEERYLCDDRPPGQREGSDWYVWSPESPMRRESVPPGTDRNEVAGSFARRAIRYHTKDYLNLVADDLLRYFSPGRHTGPTDNPVQSWQFQTSYDPERWKRLYPPEDPYVHQWTWPGTAAYYNTTLARHGFDFEKVRPRFHAGLGRALHEYQERVYTPGPLLGLFAALGLLAGIGRLPPALRRLRWSAALFGTSALLILVTAATTTTFDYRYLLPTLPLLAPAGALGASLLSERLRLREEPSAPTEAPDEAPVVSDRPPAAALAYESEDR